jgi:hypothetical protein
MNHSLIQWVAVVGAVGIVGMLIFQILLAVGLPLGAAAFGGKYEVLPAKLRLASVISAFIFAAAFFIILAHGGLLGGGSRSSSLVRVGIWVLVTIFGVSTLANIFSRSRWERLIMAPVGFVLTVCCVIVALAGSS